MSRLGSNPSPWDVVIDVSMTVTALLTLFLVGLIPLAPTEPVLVGMGVLAASGKVSLVAVIVVM